MASVSLKFEYGLDCGCICYLVSAAAMIYFMREVLVWEQIETKDIENVWIINYVLFKERLMTKFSSLEMKFACSISKNETCKAYIALKS